METNYFTVRAVLKKGKNRKDGTCPIYIVLQRNGITQRLSLSECVAEKYWDKDTEQAIGKGYGSLNVLIKKEKQNLEDFIRENKSLGKSLSTSDISNFWNGKSNEDRNFHKFYESFCIVHLDKKADATKVHYTTLKKKLENFRPKISFTDIDYSFMKEFEAYLFKTGSGVYNMTKFLKTVLGEAHRQKLTKDDSWKEYKVIRPEERTIHLTSKELSAFEKCDASSDRDLQLTKDMFLFCCYVGGMRFSDVSTFTKANYKNNAISLIQKKTKEPLVAYVDFKPKLILAKYITKCNDDEPIFPYIHNQTANKKLKELAKLSGIKKRLIFHAARHTFGTLMTEKNINAFIVSKMMGHKKMSQTYSYTSVSIDTMKNIYKSVDFTKGHEKTLLK